MVKINDYTDSDDEVISRNSSRSRSNMTMTESDDDGQTGPQAAKDGSDDEMEKKVSFEAEVDKGAAKKGGRLIDSLLGGDDDEDLSLVEDNRQFGIGGVPLVTILYTFFIIGAFCSVIAAAYYHDQDDFVTYMLKSLCKKFPFLNPILKDMIQAKPGKW